MTLNSAPAQQAGAAVDGPPATSAVDVAAAKQLKDLIVLNSVGQLTVTRPGDHVAHILPTPLVAARRAQLSADLGPLLYHSGGPIMPSIAIYVIFWTPPTLQNGGATYMSPNYQQTQLNLAHTYAGHSLGNNSTQYYQVIGDTTYIHNVGPLGGVSNLGSFGGSYTDTSPYPASGCSDTSTPGNCITDAQIQAEIQKVMTTKGWTGGLDKVFLLFTSAGEGSCFDSTGNSCAYVQYCAYHSYIPGPTPVIYGNEPFGNPTVCQVPGTPAPNGLNADTAATAAAHEITEAMTDPLLNAWFTAQGNEIGDLCAYNYGTAGWASGNANQMWNGFFFELQMMWDNHTASCVQLGP